MRLGRGILSAPLCLPLFLTFIIKDYIQQPLSKTFGCLFLYLCPSRLPGPNELPLFLEGDDSLTALAEEGTDATQHLAKQLSAVRRSQMACWGVQEDGSSVSPVRDSPVGEEGVAEREHEICMNWWQSVLERWHEKTHLVDPSLQKKFRVVNQGPWAQIMAVLADRDRANRKTFMTESEVRLGQLEL